jgi:RNA polymerase sigma-70 factor (ECF subfamily)
MWAFAQVDSSGAAALHAAPMSEAFVAGEVVERARAGDEAAFRDLFARYKKQVASQLNFLVPRSDLEDVLQDVFIEVYRSLKKFRGDSAFSTWLYRLTVHVALKSRRKQVRSRLDIVEELPDQVDPSAGPSEAVLSAERQQRVELLLQSLSPKKRAVLVLHDMRGVEAARIAEMLETNVLTVRTRLFYARREFEQLAAQDASLAEYFPREGAK